MSRYYYLVTTLPTLDLDQELTITGTEFLDLCRTHLSKKDFKVISSLYDPSSGDIPIKNKTLLAWESFEQSLIHLLAEKRAEHLGLSEKETYKNTYGKTSAITEAVRKAMAENSPLMGEKILDAARIVFLEDIEVTHYFDLTKLIVYSLKLAILERHQHFDFEEGNEEFKRLLSNIKTSIGSY